MERIYSIRGFSAVTNSQTDDPVAQLWNPDTANRVVTVYEVGIYNSSNVGSRLVLNRTTARGTPGSTETPDGDNAWDGSGAAPGSGALLDLAQFTVDPTYAEPPIWGYIRDTTGAKAGATGGGFVWTMPQGVRVLEGTGLAIRHLVTVAGTWTDSEVYYVWGEEQ